MTSTACIPVCIPKPWAIRLESLTGYPHTWFESKLVSSLQGCWLWMGSTLPKGYAVLRVSRKIDPHRKHLYLHRLFYEVSKGAIPPGLEIDHLCRNPSCITPDHLEAVSRSTNLRRGNVGSDIGRYNRAKTHCPQGHSYDKLNTYYRPDRRGRGRNCKQCRADRQRRGI